MLDIIVFLALSMQLYYLNSLNTVLYLDLILRCRHHPTCAMLNPVKHYEVSTYRFEVMGVSIC